LISRKQFLLVPFLMACLCATVANSTASNGEAEYRLRLFHTHTGERLNIVYRRGNQYIPQALDQLDPTTRSVW